MMPDQVSSLDTLKNDILALLLQVKSRPEEQGSTLRELEANLLRLAKKPGFKTLLLSGDRLAWFVVSSLEQLREMAFLSFCGWGMPLEKVVAVLMSLKPPCPAPAVWRQCYIKLFGMTASYKWSTPSLVMALNQVEDKADISAVSLRIVLKHAHRSKNFTDLVTAIRVYLPALNTSLEGALASFLEDVETQQLDISTLPRELFAPHNLAAGRLGAPANGEIRRLLWDSELSFESRMELSWTDMAWQECALARSLQWNTLEQVIAYATELYRQVGQENVRASLARKDPILALAKAAFFQNFTSIEHLSDVPAELAVALQETGFVRKSSPFLVAERHPELQRLLRKSGQNLNLATGAL